MCPATMTSLHMSKRAPDDRQAVIRPIASLISKSEKAQQKLTPGTWQHTMLRENLRALHLAFGWLSGQVDVL